jgi:lipopolysaccharide export system protein LptC
MIRNIIILVMALCVVAGGVIYFNLPDKNSEEVLTQSEPLVVLDDFEFFKYQDDQIVEVFSSRTAKLYEPNRAEFFAEVSGRRINRGAVEIVKADMVTAFFESSSLSELLGRKADLQMAVAEDNVRLHLGKDVLFTDHVEYNSKDELLRSDKPIRISGEGRKMIGQKGFLYNHKTGNIEVLGPVSGVVDNLE